jgi:cytochrome c553
MKKNVFILSLLVTTMFFAGCSNKKSEQPKQDLPELTQEALVSKGKYLVMVGGCNDCHSPKVMTEHGPEPDPSRLLSGHPQDQKLPQIIKTQDWVLFSPGLTASVGPWGTSFAANLTPDDTGIGNWSYKQFETALRKGKYKGLEGSRPLLPPMPWQNYKDVTDEDMRAIFAYLKSLRPVNNLVPQPVPPL